MGEFKVGCMFTHSDYDGLFLAERITKRRVYMSKIDSKGQKQGNGIVSNLKSKIQLATPEEIAAGHRIDQSAFNSRFRLTSVQAEKIGNHQIKLFERVLKGN